MSQPMKWRSGCSRRRALAERGVGDVAGMQVGQLAGVSCVMPATAAVSMKGIVMLPGALRPAT